MLRTDHFSVGSGKLELGLEGDIRMFLSLISIQRVFFIPYFEDAS
jgi:hypothetical protein